MTGFARAFSELSNNGLGNRWKTFIAGIRYEETPEDHALVRGGDPAWERDSELRNASIYGREITGLGDDSRYHVRDRYLVKLNYADHREGRPVPSYGLYQDPRIRLAFQHVGSATGSCVLGRTDLDIRLRPPGNATLSRIFSQAPLPLFGITPAEHSEIRERIRLVISQWGWPFGARPEQIRDAGPGEIDQIFDADNKGVVR